MLLYNWDNEYELLIARKLSLVVIYWTGNSTIKLYPKLEKIM